MNITLEQLIEIKNQWSDDTSKQKLNQFVKRVNTCNESSGNPSILFQLSKADIEVEFRLWCYGTYSVMVINTDTGQEYIMIDKYYTDLAEPKSAFEFVLNYLKD